LSHRRRDKHTTFVSAAINRSEIRRNESREGATTNYPSLSAPHLTSYRIDGPLSTSMRLSWIKVVSTRKDRLMTNSKTLMAAAAVILIGAAMPAWAVDGCKVLLCLAGPWESIPAAAAAAAAAAQTSGGVGG
jgi:hypothetical protein